MKTFRRNAVIITVLLFVCVAAYLNWSYNKNADDTQTAAEVPSAANGSNTGEDAAAENADPGLYYNASGEINKEYFETARLNRQQARDAAAAALATVSETKGASQDMIDAALAKISAIAADSIKGFADCVVYISEEGVSITVPAPDEGLPAASVAKITDVVTTQTTYKAADMKIIEVK